MDHDALARELIRALRGRRSQLAFSRRLGFRTNVAYAWESGRRSPSASAFFRAAARVGLDVGAALRSFLGGRASALDGCDPTSPDCVVVLLRELKGSMTVTAAAERAGCSRHQVSRWLSGAAEPPLASLLRVVDATSGRALDLVATLVDPATLPSAAPIWRKLVRARALASATPWATAVLVALSLDAYRALPSHEPGFIASALNIPVELELDCLSLLQEAGLVRRVGDKLVPARGAAVELRPDKPGTELKQFWAGVALQRLKDGLPGTHTWNLFPVSRAALARIDLLQRNFYRDLRAEVAASAGSADVVALAVLHLVPLSESPVGEVAWRSEAPSAP